MKARITVTPKLLKRLLDGKTLKFKFPILDYHEAAAEVEIVVEEGLDSKFERIFGKIWNKTLDKLDKLT